MGEYTDCNFCRLQRIKANAKSHKLKVTIIADANWGMGGMNVYVHPRDVDVKMLSGGENGTRAQYRASWMMEIPEHCCC